MNLKRILYNIRRSIWLYPVLYTLLAIVLASIVIIVDSRIFFDISPYIPRILTTSTDLAKSVLSIIASAFITIMTFTFSTTMVVLTMYTSQYSPRVVENFLTQKSTMKSFGIFVSGFMYSILSLLFIREILSDFKILAGTFGVIYILVGLINFIMYINNVGTYIQASNLIDRLFDKALDDIAIYKEETENYDSIGKEEIENFEAKLAIRSPKSGYIAEIYYRRLFEIATENKVLIIFDKLPGQFVTDADIIAKIYYDRNSDLKGNLSEEIGRSLDIGDRRTEVQDFSFSIQKLVEVAMKALSPGINDPNTAIQCIRDLGLLLRELSELKAGYVVIRDEDNGNRASLYRESYDLDKLLSDTFNQLIHYGKEDIFVVLSIIKAHRHILEKSNEQNREIIRRHTDYLEEILAHQSFAELDRNMIQEELREIDELFRKGRISI
ncbi:DUF2254 domain-containing protein [Proteiniclasticum sp. SCR006]|uniref:DUF2254 domain-containing protein n=1 Tax=Proteiniclasticum aestuarii TaxID=2817862 RepID=A0A939HDA6_9CLOT|nr:DUF2254 domain-containing protein [Proteiniclasticum aestuarii]MBO1265856.1 DUF2254 domain-containing protein [Proteiniclasticum aestuarii]